MNKQQVQQKIVTLLEQTSELTLTTSRLVSKIELATTKERTEFISGIDKCIEALELARDFVEATK